MVEAIKQSFPQREIADASFRYQEEVRRGERVVVGVNRFQSDDDATFRSCATIRRWRRSRSAASRARAGRDDEAAQRALAELKRAAATDENLMPHFLAAARARASEGEMIAALQEVFGTYTETPIF